MSVTYAICQRVNPTKPMEAKKFYPIVQSSGVMSVHDVCDSISAHTTFTRGDLIGAVESFLDEIIALLKQGKIVCLGSLGNFRITISGIGSATKEEVTKEKIKRSNIVFWPGKMLRDMCNSLVYQSAKKADEAVVVPPEKAPANAPAE
ncbi:MAG: HU family DNA-binding protein [Bacteroidaceae bacterium]